MIVRTLSLSLLLGAAEAYAPHAAARAGAAPPSQCAAVVEAFPCPYFCPLYASLALNTGKVWLPWLPRDCSAAAGGGRAAVECLRRPACRYAARSAAELPMSKEEVRQLLDAAAALRARCLRNASYWRSADAG